MFIKRFANIIRILSLIKTIWATVVEFSTSCSLHFDQAMLQHRHF